MRAISGIYEYFKPLTVSTACCVSILLTPYTAMAESIAFGESTAFNNQSIERILDSKDLDEQSREDFSYIKKGCLENPNLKVLRNIPVDPSNPTQTGSYDFYYSHIIRDVSAPTIVYLPGGPGSGSINSGKTFPEVYNVVFIDPRGTGCNFKDSNDFSPSFFSTDFVTNDIVALIKHLKLTNYIIYGHSYGTILATYTVKKVEEDNEIVKPRGVLLEGVVGKAWETWKKREEYRAEVATRFINENTNVKTLLSDPSNLPFGYRAEYWGYKLEYAGRIWNYRLQEMNDLFNFLNGNNVDIHTKEQFQSSYEDFEFQFNEAKQTELDFLFKQVACTELSEVIDIGKRIPILDNGSIKMVEHHRSHEFNDQCLDVKTPYRPYDSKKLQIQSPIIYVNGETDTATPVWSARYHFDNQAMTSKKTFIEVSKGGHYPIKYMPLVCKSKFFENIFNQSHDFSSTSTQTSMILCGKAY